ncbi:hypothetical protein [Streptomyces sp. MAR25Y5]|uniref:hypothetical protein n=1 Tax=Streptomyces sp. MAR25Y5 TaxID=2962028 RepID=UPI0020B6FE82|nr:hypothetical protein [Streptomyces sp. MAR25Y5]MCP3771224.1 hypothetical protein [Streptomyces sp. MAR25Y5]
MREQAGGDAAGRLPLRQAELAVGALGDSGAAAGTEPGGDGLEVPAEAVAQAVRGGQSVGPDAFDPPIDLPVPTFFVNSAKGAGCSAVRSSRAAGGGRSGLLGPDVVGRPGAWDRTGQVAYGRVPTGRGVVREDFSGRLKTPPGHRRRAALPALRAGTPVRWTP